MTLDGKTSRAEDPHLIIRLLQQELKETNHEVLLLNLELEKRVDERTSELKSANAQLDFANKELQRVNRELEAFSYSISHDLRAPLRAISGFSHAVLKDFGPQLPAGGLRLLQVIISSTNRMSHMIDDLLRFSRLGRQPLPAASVDVAALGRAVLRAVRR